MSPLLELQTFVPPDIEIERRDDGSTVLSSRRAAAEAGPTSIPTARSPPSETPTTTGSPSPTARPSAGHGRWPRPSRSSGSDRASRS